MGADQNDLARPPPEEGGEWSGYRVAERVSQQHLAPASLTLC
jgi:hypothetical protein